MTVAIRATKTLTAHAVCMAAGLRDGLRTAQFYLRDLSGADGGGKEHAARPTPLSRAVARLARMADRLLNFSADWSVRLLVPRWRELPSPFAPGMRAEVISAIRENRLVMTSLFTAYFFRAARHILERATERPNLVLEHRIDAARRLMLAADVVPSDARPEHLLATALLYLVEADPIAKNGRLREGHRHFEGADPNLWVMATACLALLLAEDGKPLESLDEDEFFAIAAALLAPRIRDMAQAVLARDVQALAGALAAVRELY